MPILSLTETRKQRLTRYLRDQFSLAASGSNRRQDILRTFIARYEAKTVQKNFPFRGASSIHVPIVAEYTDSIKSKIINALKAQPDAFIDVNPLTEEEIGSLVDPTTGKPATWRLVAELLEEYMLFEISSAGQVNLIDSVDTFVDDVVMLGTGWMCPVWSTERQYDYPIGGGPPVQHTSFDNMRFLNPAVEDMFFPPFYDSLERIPWLSRRYLARPSEILNRVGGPTGFNSTSVSEFLSKHRTNTSKISLLDEERMIAAGAMDPFYYTTGEIPLAETWMRFVLDEPLAESDSNSSSPSSSSTYGKEVRILVDHSFDEPYTIFRIMPWPYEHGKMAAVVARYIKRRGRMEGMGIPERLESLDDGLSTTVNQMIDNVSAANTRLWRARTGSDAAEALEDIWCNKVIPGEQGDLEAIQMGEVYPSIFEAHNVIRDHAEKISKVVDNSMQDVATARNSTATTTLALQQELGQYHDSITRNIRIALNDALQQWRDLIAQQKPLSRIREILGPRAEVLVTALTLPPSDFAKRIGVQVSFSNTAATRELGRQEEQAKLQIMQGYYAGLIQLAQLEFGNLAAQQPPASAPLATLINQIAKDSDLRMRKLLEQYGERSSTSLLPDWTKVLQAYAAEQQQLAQQQQLAAAAGLSPTGASSGNGAPEAAGGVPGGTLSPAGPPTA